jgi:hypothetical protein
MTQINKKPEWLGRAESRNDRDDQKAGLTGTTRKPERLENRNGRISGASVQPMYLFLHGTTRTTVMNASLTKIGGMLHLEPKGKGMLIEHDVRCTKIISASWNKKMCLWDNAYFRQRLSYFVLLSGSWNMFFSQDGSWIKRHENIHHHGPRLLNHYTCTIDTFPTSLMMRTLPKLLNGSVGRITFVSTFDMKKIKKPHMRHYCICSDHDIHVS